MPARRGRSGSLVVVFLTATLLTALSLELGRQGLSAGQGPQLVDAAGVDPAGITHHVSKEVGLRGEEDVTLKETEVSKSKTSEETEPDQGASLVVSEVPTDEDLDDVKSTTEAADGVIPSDEALTDVKATTEALDMIPTNEALDDVKSTTDASDDVFPTEEPVDDVMPTDEALDDVIPIDEALDDVLPTDEALDDVIPIDEALDDVILTDDAIRDATPITEALTTSDEAMDEGTSSPERQNKLVRDDDNLATSLLMDIRDALYSERDGQEEQTLRDSVEQRLDALTSETEGSIGRISSNFERLRHNMDEKVSLVLETFSTLKVLVLSQGDHLRALQERLLRVENQAHDVEVQAQAFRMSLDEVKSSPASYRTPAGDSSYHNDNGLEGKDDDDVLDPQVNITKFAERIEEPRPSLTDLTSQMKEITDAVKSIKDELQVVQTNVTNLSFAPLSLTDNKTRRDTHTAVRDSTSCRCPTDQLRNSITKLEAAQQQQKSEMDELARNLTLGDVPRETSDGSWLFRHRLGVVEGTLTDLTAVKTKVNAVQEDLYLLKEEMGKTATQVNANTNVTTTTSNVQGMCVWPYKRGGGGCFHVHTEDRLSWQAAREHCRTLQGDLAAPLNYNHFKLFILKQRLSRAYTYWLGASDAGLEGQWTWTDGRPVSPDTWETSQPDPRSAKCMALKPVYKFVASAEACRESRFFICQQERQL